jgi:hypothetical protein
MEKRPKMRRSFVDVALTLLEGITLFWVGGIAAWLALEYCVYSFRSISDALYTASLATLILLLWCPRAWFPDWWLRSLCIRLTSLSTFSMLLMCADFFAHHYADPWSSSWIHGPFVFMFLVIKWGGALDSNPASRICRLAPPFLLVFGPAIVRAFQGGG